MYEAHFGLSKNPFQSIAEGDGVFEGPAQAKVIADLKMALTAKDSIAVITGPVGVGKTTIVQRALEQLGPERLVAILGRTQVVSDELVDLLLAQFGVVGEPARRFECLKTFNKILSEQADAGARVFIVIEDAERLGVDLLEELEALTAADGGACAGANIVLMGPQKLDKLIARPSLERVRQRIRLQQTLDRFTADEVESYLRHRIKASGGEFDAIFEAGTSLMIRRCSGGIPRVINSLCETALKMAAEGNISQVSGKTVFKVAVEVFGMSPGDSPASQAPSTMPPQMAPAAMPPASQNTPPAKVAEPAPPAAKVAEPAPPPAKVAEPAPPPAAAPTAPAAKKADPVARTPASIAARPPAAADKSFDPTVSIPKMQGAPDSPTAPQHIATSRAPNPPASAPAPPAKPAPPAAATNGAAAPAAEAKPSADKSLPKQPPKFKFADEIVVDKNTKPASPVQPPKQTVSPKLPTLEPDEVGVKIASEKPQPAQVSTPPSAAASPATPAAKPAPSRAKPDTSLQEPSPAADRSQSEADATASFAKVDHDMLDAALASLAVHDKEDETEPEVQARPDARVAPASIPEVTLDKSIEAKRAEAKAASDAEEMDLMAAELQVTQSLEDMSDKLAETLFGSEELEAISLLIREEAAPVEVSPVALEPPAAAGVVAPAAPPATPAPQAAKTSPEPAPQVAKTSPEPAPPKPPTAPTVATPPKPAEDVAMGSKPAAAASPQKKGPQLEPIENQFKSSMTATLKTLNSRSNPPVDDTASEKSSGGLLGRLKDTFKS